MYHATLLLFIYFCNVRLEQYTLHLNCVKHGVSCLPLRKCTMVPFCFYGIFVFFILLLHLSCVKSVALRPVCLFAMYIYVFFSIYFCIWPVINLQSAVYHCANVDFYLFCNICFLKFIFTFDLCQIRVLLIVIARFTTIPIILFYNICFLQISFSFLMYRIWCIMFTILRM